jgi:hypothetical protein
LDGSSLKKGITSCLTIRDQERTLPLVESRGGGGKVFFFGTTGDVIMDAGEKNSRCSFFSHYASRQEEYTLGDVFPDHDPSCGDDFALVVDTIDAHVGANVVSTRGDRFPAIMKFEDLFFDRWHKCATYGPDLRRFDRVSRVLQLGRSVSVKLHNGRRWGNNATLCKQLYNRQAPCLGQTKKVQNMLS